jgi:hypothetical protein
MEHKLKILPEYFNAVKEGTKTFEIRKNDRGFKVGDTLLLKEWVDRKISKIDDIRIEASPYFTGQEITKEVTYFLEGGQCGLEEGYCILGLKEYIKSIGNCARCGKTLVNNEECKCEKTYKGMCLEFLPIRVEKSKNNMFEGIQEFCIMNSFDEIVADNLGSAEAEIIVDATNKYYNNQLIEIKNIDLTGLTLVDELEKAEEEEKEFKEALITYLYDTNEVSREHLLEESCDKVQVILSTLKMLDIDIEEITEYWNTKHLEKLKNRPRKEDKHE